VCSIFPAHANLRTVWQSVVATLTSEWRVRFGQGGADLMKRFWSEYDMDREGERVY
jgi:hypothetical protein